PPTESAQNIKNISQVNELKPPEKKEPAKAPEQKADGILKPQTLQSAAPAQINKPQEKMPTEADVNKLGEGEVKQAPLSEALMGQPSLAKQDMENKPAAPEQSQDNSANADNATPINSPDETKTAEQNPAENTASGEEMAFEKTLPLIYPEEDEK
ncbi:MAG: hypothetical protein KAQ76_04660, partial [Elusimicrobiales bacterium]|nr:hypothetical protein [Elusimicrobiales bacterium]